jgi:hypothetical protein
MPVTVSHALSATTPDDPTFEIRPSHWNSGHAFTVNLIGSEISGAFSNAGNVSFGFDGTNITATAQDAGDGLNRISAGTQVAGTNQTVSFADSNGVSWGLNGSTLTATVATNYQSSNANYLTSQSNQAFSASGGSSAFQTLNFANSNGLTFSNSNGSVIASYTVPTQTAQSAIKGFGASNTGNTAGNTGISSGIDWILGGTNNITISESTAGGGANTLWISGPTQSVQTGGIYVTAQSTGQSSSSTYDLRTLSMVGDGIVSAGWSNGTFRISATQSNQAFSAAGGSSAFQTLGFSDNAAASFTNNGSIAIASIRASIFATSNTTQSSSGTQNLNSLIFAGAGIASVGMTNGSVVISVPSGGGAGDGGVFAGVSTMGNTAGSTGTVSTGVFVLVGTNGISLSQSTGAAGSAATITINGPGTTSFVAQGGLTVSQNGSTVSYGDAVLPYFEPHIRGQTAPTGTGSTLSAGSVFFQPFYVSAPISMYRANIPFNVTSQGTSTLSFSASVSSQTSSAASGSAGTTGTLLLYSRVSTGNDVNSSNIVSFFSNSYSLSMGLSHSVSWSTNASSATVSWTTSQGIGYMTHIDSVGGTTTSSFTSSNSSTFSSTSTNQNSFSSSTANTFASGVMSGIRPIMVPFATSLTPGEYWLAHIFQTSSSSTVQNLAQPLRIGPLPMWYSTNTTGYAEFGSTATIANSNFMDGLGLYSASSQTSTTIPLSNISGQSQVQYWWNFMAHSK